MIQFIPLFSYPNLVFLTGLTKIVDSRKLS